MCSSFRSGLSGSQINSLFGETTFSRCHLCAAASGVVSLAVRLTVCLERILVLAVICVQQFQEWSLWQSNEQSTWSDCILCYKAEGHLASAAFGNCWLDHVYKVVVGCWLTCNSILERLGGMIDSEF